jgi:hypothetical protein
MTRSRWLLVLCTALFVVSALPGLSAPAAAQSRPDAAAMADDPGLPQVVPTSRRNRYVGLSTAGGAVLGVILVDIVAGGILLSPLGLPSAAALVSVEAAAAARPTYLLVQRLFAGVATAAAAVGGGYVGSRVARPGPDFLRLEE